MTTNRLPFTAIIVDDEDEARDNLQSLILASSGGLVAIVGMAGSTAQAEQLVKEKQPDALFLDIELGKDNAFQWLSQIGSYTFEIVFVTGYNNYAVKAFKLNALDYLLKPIDIDELRNAI